MQELLDRGISSRRGIMTTHRETAYKSKKYLLPISEDLADRSIILPLYVPMLDDDIKYIVESLNLIIAV